MNQIEKKLNKPTADRVIKILKKINDNYSNELYIHEFYASLMYELDIENYSYDKGGEYKLRYIDLLLSQIYYDYLIIDERIIVKIICSARGKSKIEERIKDVVYNSDFMEALIVDFSSSALEINHIKNN
ncbi:MAG: hypothetical protein JEY94_07820 [Melioribacteraceae bacterium]|nr:hypothetical protein [Melioribacteraceae bacterium]